MLRKKLVVLRVKNAQGGMYTTLVKVNGRVGLIERLVSRYGMNPAQHLPTSDGGIPTPSDICGRRG